MRDRGETPFVCTVSQLCDPVLRHINDYGVIDLHDLVAVFSPIAMVFLPMIRRGIVVANGGW